MRTIASILVIFLVQCGYLRAELKPGIIEDIGELLGSDSCIFGAKSMSTYLYDSISKGDTIKVEEICNNVSLQPITFVVHGFISSPNVSSFQELDSELAQKGYTVFAVDWSQGACTNEIPIVKFLEYPFAVDNTREIGRYVASSVKSLLECGVPLENITFIGHSLGAHVCGFAAKEIQTWGHGNISLIIAADPARPLFSFNNCTNKLCKTDANCVKVLHTSVLGIPKRIGHEDFQFQYNGHTQPGCKIDIGCSHTRSVEYVTNIMKNDCGFPGVSIKKMLRPFQRPPPYPSSNTTDCIFINNNILDNQCSTKGSFYVFVQEKEPYCTQNTFNCNNNY